MEDLNTVLSDTQKSVSDMLATAEKSGAAWLVPRAPGKWSPSQVVEHVSRAMEESAKAVNDQPAKFPRLPFFLRPLARGMLFNRVLAKRAFPKARTNKPMNPELAPPSPPATPADGRKRLENAVASFDQACRARGVGDQELRSTTFGTVGLAEWARFQEVHVQHHHGQLPKA